LFNSVRGAIRNNGVFNLCDAALVHL
jgi:hypothetical protein